MHEPEKNAKRSRATLADVAKKAGVSLATVDRVLNERGLYSAATQDRVLAAARSLGLRRILPARHLKNLHVEVILTRPDLPLNQRFGDEFEALNQLTGKLVTIHRSFLRNDDPLLLARRIRETACDGIVVNVEAHPEIHRAVHDASGRGKAVVTIMSDLPRSARLAYAGIDHLSAGRSAAFFMAKMSPRPGGVVVLCNHLGYQGHRDRVRGFLDSLDQHGAGLDVAAVVEGQDDPDISERKLRRVLGERPDIVGIYNTGAANRAVAAVIRSGVLAQPPVFIGHELTPFTRTALRDGTMTLAIDQSPELQARLAVDILMRHFGILDAEEKSVPLRPEVPFVLFGPENLPNR
ncbi:LacI family DNA-binding transcriptional regulator [Paracoccus lichenicola]|uniref:LacI family DNA-binding transcriptional regulator n=1 Tax=Paracoccus lichenicola TaxID=2665644 RepID=UPI0018AA9AA0|nr:LacI family DNA-binding transcriptional regulator [Paracoccus lichenicola]